MISLRTKIFIGTGGLIILLILGNIAQAYFLVQTTQKNRTLNESLGSLKATFKQQRKQKEFQIDSLEHCILENNHQNEILWNQIESYEQTLQTLNKNSDEDKTRILRLHDLDSLRDEVTRHYR